jgi:hypothetical protein
MVLRFSKTPQLHYGNAPSAVDRVVRKLPQGALPIASVPLASAVPQKIVDADGSAFWCLHHKDGWRRLAPEKDSRTGAVSWRMDGTSIRQPVAWVPRKK